MMHIAHFMVLSAIVGALLDCGGSPPPAATPVFDPNRCFYRSQQGKQSVIDEFHSPEHFSSGSVLSCTVPLPMKGIDCYMEAASDIGGGIKWEVRGAYEVTNAYTSHGESVMWFACTTKPCNAPADNNLCGDWDHCCRVHADFGK